jgi:hypothetical protein
MLLWEGAYCNSSERHTISKSFDISQILGSVDTAWGERHLDSRASICGSFLDGSSATKNNEVS